MLDVGGGAGVYASWLAGVFIRFTWSTRVRCTYSGPILAASSRPRLTSHLAQPDDSRDAVLLLGLLYHFTERVDRVQALAQDRRVRRPGGVGLVPGRVLSVEGMLHWAPNIDARLADPTQRQLLLDFLAATETGETAYAATTDPIALGVA